MVGLFLVVEGIEFLSFEHPVYLVELPASAFVARSERAGGVLDRRDVLDLMHDRSCVTIDPRISTMPGRSGRGGRSERARGRGGRGCTRYHAWP